MSEQLITALLDLLAPEIERMVHERVAEQLAENVKSCWPQWMSVATAARYLDVSVERLWHLKRAGQIPFVQDEPNARVFFGRADLDQWMETKRCP
jgi:excisionase family DNA binding protein